MIRFERKFYTPEISHQILGQRDRNRSLQEKAARALAADMKSGSYEETHQTIAFDPGGRLVDGQHRLRAVAIAGVGVWLWTATYDSAEHADRAMRVLDRGKSRRLGDALEITGIVDGDGKGHAATAEIVYSLTARGGTGRTDAVVAAIARSQAHHYAAIRACLVGTPNSAVMGAFVFMRPISPDIVDALARRMASPVGLTPTEAALFTVIGERIMGGSDQRRDQALRIIRGIEAAIDGETLCRVILPRDVAGLIARLERRRAVVGAAS